MIYLFVYVIQPALELRILLSFLSAGVTCMRHHTWLNVMSSLYIFIFVRVCVQKHHGPQKEVRGQFSKVLSSVMYILRTKLRKSGLAVSAFTILLALYI